jgi:hypothetical protein
VTNQNDIRIEEACRYVEELGWWLTLVRGSGDKPKAPLISGWPDFRPSATNVRTLLEHNWDAGIGINLGGSGLIDVEADTLEGEQILDDLCRGHDFPCWQARRGKHRLFLAGEGDEFTKDSNLAIEFRTGRHQSVLPPSIIEGTTYSWVVNPFVVPVPPLPDELRNFYEERRPKRTGRTVFPKRVAGFEFRDHFDYVLRNFDLLHQVTTAGLALVVPEQDASGNVPCFVPSELRGRPDRHPSGLFNVKSGVLRDFFTETNYPFFKVMAALSGESWQTVFKRFETSAGAEKGRPHSRRVSVPVEWTSERASLEEVRGQLAEHFDQQLDREPIPKTLHIIKGPPGLGKTFTLCKKLAKKRKKAVVLTLENDLADQHSTLLPASVRMPVLRQDGCIHPDEYEATARRGFKPSQSLPCGKCSVGTMHCKYLLRFRDLADAEQLCCAAIYHTHADFYSSHGNENRPIVVFDENCMDLLLEPVSTKLEDWESWLAMIEKSESKADQTALRNLVSWLKTAQADFVPAMKDDEKLKFQPCVVPDSIRVPGMKASPALEEWLHKNAARNPSVFNLYKAALYLLTEPSSYVLLERIVKEEGDLILIRFRKKNPLPEDKEVFVLDATANEELLKAMAPGWDVRVWNCPPIAQAGEIIQIMDYDLSRNRIRGEIENHEPDNPSWLVQVIDRILEKHGPAALISFKSVVDGATDLLSQLRHQDKIVRTDNFPCRGHSFDEKTLIVVGTPYKNEASFWELAMAIWGETGLPRSDYCHRKEQNGEFVSKNMGYEDGHLRPLQEFIISADLVQAIGRVRPLQNESKVFVLSNAPIQDWYIQQFTAGEVFDIRQPLRTDAADNFREYVEAARTLLTQKKFFGNKEVCEIIDMPIRSGQNHWKRFRRDLKAPVKEENGRIRLDLPDVLIF